MALEAKVKLSKKKSSMMATTVVNGRRTARIRVSDRGFVNGEEEEEKLRLGILISK